MKKTILLICFLSFQNFFLFAQEDWELSRDSDGIKVHTKMEEGYSFKSFKANSKINGSVHQFIDVLLDIENFPDWGYNVESAKLLERLGDTVQVYYSIAKAPFPYKNRDGIYLNRSKWNAKTKTLLIDIEVLYDYMDLDDKYIRVKGYGYWKVIVLSENKIDVTFFMQVDPGGNVPSWLANMFVDGTPYHTLLNLKETIEKSTSKKKYDFID